MADGARPRPGGGRIPVRPPRPGRNGRPGNGLPRGLQLQAGWRQRSGPGQRHARYRVHRRSRQFQPRGHADSRHFGPGKRRRRNRHDSDRNTGFDLRNGLGRRRRGYGNDFRDLQPHRRRRRCPTRHRHRIRRQRHRRRGRGLYRHFRQRGACRRPDRESERRADGGLRRRRQSRHEASHYQRGRFLGNPYRSDGRGFH